MKRYRRFGIYVAVFAGLLLALYLMMVLSAVIPNAAIQKNMRKSAKYFLQEDLYAFSDDGLYRNITDNYADQIWTNIGWNMGGGDPFRSVLDTKYYDGKEHALSAGLHLTVTKGYEPNVDYTRYWHGTAALIRILHLVTDIQGVRNIGMLCLLLLIFRTVLALYRAGHWELGACVVVSLLAVQLGNLRLSVEYLPCFLIGLGLCPAFLRLEQKGDFCLNVLSVMAGTLTAFFDFLTTETVTLLFPLILVVAVRSRERRLGSPRRLLKTLAGCGLCWMLAYAGAFAAKWILVTLATGENHLLNAWGAAGTRMSGVIPEAQQKLPGLLMAIGANLTVFFEGTSRTEFRRVFGYLIALAIAAMVVMRLGRTRKKAYPGTRFVLILGGIVFLRYGLLVNHSYLHAFFTYRAMASTILAVLSAMVINLCPMKKRGS